MIAGGAETTRTVIAHGLRILADHPDDWEYLAEHPEAIDGAIEELIRWVTPLNNMFRTAAVDTELAGTAIAAGDRLALVYPVRVVNEPIVEPNIFARAVTQFDLAFAVR